MPKEIRVTVNSDGTTKTDLSGFTGPSCLDVAEQLRQLLAARFGITSDQTNFIAKPELARVEETQPQTQKREAQHE